MIALSRAPGARDGYEAILRLGELGVLPPDFARSLAPLAGLRNVLAHEYVALDWDEIVQALGRLDDLREVGRLVREWLRGQPGEPTS